MTAGTPSSFHALLGCLRLALCLLVLLLLLPACAHQARNPDARQIGMADKEYSRLTQKALGGDKDAAETLARLWYQYEEGSNEKALYWGQVAAQNGSKRAAAALRYARKRADGE